MTKEHVENSIRRAIEGDSELSEFVLNVRGFSTPTMRRLFHNLCDISGTYLEVGLYCGATFVSSFNKNLVSIGIEDYSQDFSVESVREELEENLNKFSPVAREVIVHYENCFMLDMNKLPSSIDILFYDAEHSEYNQTRALEYFLANMADRFLYIIDDTNWPEVKKGMLIGLDAIKSKIKIEESWELTGKFLQDDPVFHNGLCIFLIKKK